MCVSLDSEHARQPSGHWSVDWVRRNTSGWCRQAGDLLDNATTHIRELLDTRDGVTALSGFDHNEVCVFLDELCIEPKSVCISPP